MKQVDKKKRKIEKQYELGCTDFIYIHTYKKKSVFYLSLFMYFYTCIKRTLENLLILAEVFVTMENVPSWYDNIKVVC